MNTLVFAQSDSYPVAVLIKAGAFDRAEIERMYIDPLEALGVDRSDIVVSCLPYDANGKASATFIKSELESIMAVLEGLGSRVLYVADAAYFKVLARQRQAEVHLGYVCPVRLAPYCDDAALAVVLGVNHKSLIYAPHNADKLGLSLRTCAHAAALTVLPGTDADPVGIIGTDFFEDAYYPTETTQIQDMLGIDVMINAPRLAVDTETFALDVNRAGLGTIAFAWSERSGVSFCVDYAEGAESFAHGAGPNGRVARMLFNAPVRALVKQFLTDFTAGGGQLIFHNAVFDIKVLIRALWMTDASDVAGLISGLNVLMPDSVFPSSMRAHDTRLMAYLCLNTTSDLDLSLKSLGHGHAGNYAVEDIKDILRIGKKDLLRYNLVDACTTFHLFERYEPMLVDENQDELYTHLFMPSQRVIVQMELTGMPLNAERIDEVRTELETIRDGHHALIVNSPLVMDVRRRVTLREWQKDFEDRRTKAKNPEGIQPKDRCAYPTVAFKANSPKQMHVLLHDVMALPVIERTKTGQPAVGADVLEMLVNHCTDPEHARLLDALVGYNEAQKILSTFIAAFDRAAPRKDARSYLMGCYLMGGTVSGRLSSSNPNMQNLPSNSTYGKLVKSCVQPPKGWLFVGADFNALETVTNALITKDPAKLEVLINGYDGHAYHAYAYWPDAFPEIQAALAPEMMTGEYVRVTHDDGTIECLSTTSERYRELVANAA